MVGVPVVVLELPPLEGVGTSRHTSPDLWVWFQTHSCVGCDLGLPLPPPSSLPPSPPLPHLGQVQWWNSLSLF